MEQGPKVEKGLSDLANQNKEMSYEQRLVRMRYKYTVNHRHLYNLSFLDFTQQNLLQNIFKPCFGLFSEVLLVYRAFNT